MKRSLDARRPESRSLGSALIAVTIALATCGCGSSSRDEQDRRFIESVRADGRTIPFGITGEELLIDAAREVCSHETGAESADLARQQHEVVDAAFPDGPDRLVAFAQATYCPR